MNTRDFNYWTEMIFRSRITVLEVCGVVFGLVVVGTLLWPPIYQGTAKIFVRDYRAELLVSPGMCATSPQSTAVVTNPVSEEDLNSEMELLTSNYIIKRAIADMPPPARHQGITAPLLNGVNYVLGLPGAGYRAMHDTSRNSTRAMPGRTSWNSISRRPSSRSRISSKSTSGRTIPLGPSSFSSVLIGAYLDYHAHISHDPAAEKFFSQQANLLQTRLDEAEGRLRDFQVKSGITSVDDQRSGLVDRLDTSCSCSSIRIRLTSPSTSSRRSPSRSSSIRRRSASPKRLARSRTWRWRSLSRR